MSKNRTENPNIASGRIDMLEKDEIFVFGSNLAGKHLGGAAKAAHNKFGAQWGVGVGWTGQAYAIPTMQGGVEAIKPYVDEFIEFAQEHQEMKFLVNMHWLWYCRFQGRRNCSSFQAGNSSL